MVDSHVGQGTTFTIHFPIVARQTDDTPRDSAVLPTGSEHILFVDDDDAIVGMMEGALVNMGYRVTTCDSSVDALSLFHAIAYDVDLVISDMTMPVMTGDKLAVEMLKIRSDIPIILSTGYSKSLSADHANEIGIRKILNKPVALMDLARTIRDVLDNDQPPSGRPDQG
jgi:DNA-binding NtrC family response regulator